MGARLVFNLLAAFATLVFWSRDTPVAKTGRNNTRYTHQLAPFASPNTEFFMPSEPCEAHTARTAGVLDMYTGWLFILQQQASFQCCLGRIEFVSRRRD